jgi:hypothetical protein
MAKVYRLKDGIGELSLNCGKGIKDENGKVTGQDSNFYPVVPGEVYPEGDIRVQANRSLFIAIEAGPVETAMVSRGRRI